MKTIFNVLQDIEKLIYKILMWMILIPKTLVRIVVQPRQAAEYVHSELEDGESHFDEYVSPVILLLVVALLPALAYNVLPNLGTTISSSAVEELTTERYIPFVAQTDLISVSPDLEYFMDWEVWRKDADGEFDLEYYEYNSNFDETIPPEQIDINTIEGRFKYSFSPGEYRVYVNGGDYKYDSAGDLQILESYDANITVKVPLDSNKYVEVFNEAGEIVGDRDAPGASKFLDTVKDEQTIFLALALMIPPLLFAFVTKLFKVGMGAINESTLKESFYVQCYYFSPLSVAIWGTFYAFYFFTSDAYWYASFNVTLQVLLLPVLWAGLWFVRTEYKRISWELEKQSIDADEKQPAGAEKIKDERVITSEDSQWVIRTEIEKISQGEETNVAKVDAASPSETTEIKKPVDTEKNLVESSILKFKTILIVAICFVILGYGVYLITTFNEQMDNLRLGAIRAFPILTILLLIGFTYFWYKRRIKQEGTLLSWNVARNVAGLVSLTVLFIFAMNRITAFTESDYQSADEAEPQSTSPAAEAVVTMTPVASSEGPVTLATPTSPLQRPSPIPATATATAALQVVSPYYTEEFNSLPTSFFAFMTYGDPRMVTEEVDLGMLSIGLNPLEDKYSWYYLINNEHTYSNVRVEAVVTNQGNNANGISLICNYSNIGWYEVVFSSSGVYKVLAVDNQGIVNQGYNEIDDGGSEQIKNGLSTNVFAITCEENKITIFINNEKERTVVDNKFRLIEGKIGLAVSSPQKLPVRVNFESLTVSEP